jgi:hypothetical protein
LGIVLVLRIVKGFEMQRVIRPEAGDYRTSSDPGEEKNGVLRPDASAFSG